MGQLPPSAAKKLYATVEGELLGVAHLLKSRAMSIHQCTQIVANEMEDRVKKKFFGWLPSPIFFARDVDFYNFKYLTVVWASKNGCSELAAVGTGHGGGRQTIPNAVC